MQRIADEKTADHVKQQDGAAGNDVQRPLHADGQAKMRRHLIQVVREQDANREEQSKGAHGCQQFFADAVQEIISAALRQAACGFVDERDRALL